MGQLVIESIAVWDFLSWVHGELALGGRGPVAVIGHNGAGKSTIASRAIAWGLYGQCAPERMGASTRKLKGKEVIRKRLRPEHQKTPKPKEARVQLVLMDLDTGVHWTVSRIRKRSGGDKLELLQDGDHYSNDQTDIDNLIGATYDVFVRTCLRGQNDPWMFAEAPDSKKREVIDVISGADRLIDAHQKAANLKKTTNNEIAVVRKRADDAERRAGAQDIDKLVKATKQWDGQQAHRVAEAEIEIKALSEVWVTAEADDAAASEASAKRTELEKRRPFLDLSPYDEAISAADIVVARAQAQLDAATRERTAADALVKAGHCPTCHQAVGSETVHGRLIDLDPMRATLNGAKQTAAENRDTKRLAVEWLAKEIAAWQAAVDALPAGGPAKAPGAENMLRMAEKRLEDIQRAENPMSSALEHARNAQHELLREAAVLRETETLLDEDLGLAEAWETVLSPKGVRAHIAEGSLAAIETEANKWLAVLADGRFAVRFDTTKATAKGSLREEIVTVIEVGGDPFDLLNCSGGERARINLAVDLGVAAAMTRGRSLALSLLVLDEQVFSGLDAAGKKGVTTALYHAGVSDILVIDHSDDFTGALPRTVEVSLGEDGYSELREI